MRFCRAFTGGLALLSGLAWVVPPWIWSLPWGGALIWLYVGGPVSILGWLYDRKYRLLWGLLSIFWTAQVAVVWKVWPAPAHSPSPLRIGSFNMDAAHYRRPQIERIADSLAKWHPHILCLQEVYLGDYSPKGFARRLGYQYFHFLDAGGATGMLVLSHFPIVEARTHLLLPGSTNGLQEVLLRLPSKRTLRVLHVHFPSYRLGGKSNHWSWSWLRTVWKAQKRFAECLLDQVTGKEAIWVCGDFNALPFHPLYWTLRARGLQDSFWKAKWGMGPSWRYPWLRIDYIWSSLEPRFHQIRWLPGQAHAYVEGGYSLPSTSQKAVLLSQTGR